MANQLGERIKQLRKENSLLQRQVATELKIDDPMLCKIERGERKAKKEQVLLLAKLFKANKNELITLWLADQLVDVLKDEEMALQAMQVAEDQVKYNFYKKQ